MAAAVIFGFTSCSNDSSTHAVDINALYTDAAADDPPADDGHDEDQHDPSSHAVVGAIDDTEDMSLINTVGDVPDIEMTDVSTGARVNLQSFVDNEKPLLFWFWSPH